MNSILKNISNALKKQKPFVCYKKPNNSILNGLFLNTETLYYTKDFSEKGFVFAPFDNKKKAILFPLTESTSYKETIKDEEVFSDENKLFNTENDFEKQHHISLVNKGITAIQNKNFTKIVLSRKERIEVDLDVLLVFKKLIHFYKNAFVYVWYHPKIGLWLGATPETLLKFSNNFFETMSLAGTQPFVDKKLIYWGKKELEEQKLVTDFITTQLKDISLEINVLDTMNLKAGNLLHLKTEVKGELKEEFTLENLIRALHPTPAVCGFPRREAKEFIVKNENYKRTFYTGFLGELNYTDNNVNQTQSHLFVNLRCMNIINNKTSIYVGGGITKDSNAKREWLETVEKSKTIKRVLNN